MTKNSEDILSIIVLNLIWKNRNLTFYESELTFNYSEIRAFLLVLNGFYFSQLCGLKYKNLNLGKIGELWQIKKKVKKNRRCTAVENRNAYRLIYLKIKKI